MIESLTTSPLVLLAALGLAGQAFACAWSYMLLRRVQMFGADMGIDQSLSKYVEEAAKAFPTSPMVEKEQVQNLERLADQSAPDDTLPIPELKKRA